MARDTKLSADTTATPDLLTSGLLGRPGAGVFSVVIGRRLRDLVLARCLGFRHRGVVSVGLMVTPVGVGDQVGQRMIRSFDGHEVVSTVIWNERDGTVVERFFGGLLRLGFRPTVDPNPGRETARLELLGAALTAGPISIPVPRWALPLVTAETRRLENGLRVRIAVRSHRQDGGDMLTYEGLMS